ncbi:hypothetical protein FY406_03220 [Streptococcus ratti]|nr:hypothetical protein FY406_03220 [Streptococcus ratti]
MWLPLGINLPRNRSFFVRFPVFAVSLTLFASYLEHKKRSLKTFLSMKNAHKKLFK